VKPTDTRDPNYFHKVVDCQWACPAHTNVPEYIRLIAQGRYSDAYMLNRASNVFPGILGRTCDRPCEPACRRTRVDGQAVAICRLKRVAADLKDDVTDRLPGRPNQRTASAIACIGAGPPSLTVANDLPAGYRSPSSRSWAPPAASCARTSPALPLRPQVLARRSAWSWEMGLDVRYNSPGAAA
jgi:hypothetical protein